MISVPAVIHFKILSLLAWRYYDCTVRFIQSVPKIDYAAGEPWAMECRREMEGVQLQPTRPSESMSLDTADKAEEFFRDSPSLRALRYHLRQHSGLSASLLHTPAFFWKAYLSIKQPLTAHGPRDAASSMAG